jgi:hypothetical protein
MGETILLKIKEHHQTIRTIITKIENETNLEAKKELYLELSQELSTHMESEEKTIYKHLTEDVGDEEAEEIAHDAFDEHEEIRFLIDQLDKLSIENKNWDETFDKLAKTFIEHQIKEEVSLFAEAREEFSKQELIDFGEEFEEVKIDSYP